MADDLVSAPDIIASSSRQQSLGERLLGMRMLTNALAAPLSAEDQCVQAMDDASPTKWHLAHTTWFFETFVLARHAAGYRIFDDRFHYCFNSYYEAEGPRHPRPQRGLLTRPSVQEVMDYRRHVDDALAAFIESAAAQEPALASLLELGLNHEQQHQELLLTDILALFARSPLRPPYRERAAPQGANACGPMNWTPFDGGIVEAGSDGAEFCFDNETPRHQVLLHPFKLANRLVTNGEWMEFMRDGGYSNAGLWLADGWAAVRSEGWEAPLYWERRDEAFMQMSLNGLQPVDCAAPVCHISYYEADAFARWAGKRLPTEFEWEAAARTATRKGNVMSSGWLTPRPCKGTGALEQMFGDVWEWTGSAYLPYPGFKPAAGAVGEYNGKFMVSQHVLRGASCVTAEGHSRATYRNFFYPWQRWQFTGLRLADDAR